MKKITLSTIVIAIYAAYVVFIKSFVSSGTDGVPGTISLSPGQASSIGTNARAAIKYRDGNYKGISADAFYGNVQVQAIIKGGQLTDVKVLDYPQDRGNSIRINTQAVPALITEAIQAQSANVDIVTGATATSEAFRQSLITALNQAT